MKQADAMSTSVIEARKDYLERIAFKRGVVTERNEHLEEWFVANPAERIVALEKALFDGGDRDPDRREGGEELEKTLSVIVEEGEGGDADAVCIDNQHFSLWLKCTSTGICGGEQNYVFSIQLRGSCELLGTILQL